MQQITLVFWWHAHTNISSLQIFPLQRIEKKHTNSNKLIWYQTAAGKASSAFLPRFCGCFVGILSRHHCKTPMKLRMAKTMKRQPEIGKFSTFFVGVLLGFCLWDPTRDPQNEPVYQNHLMIALVGKISIPKHFLETIIRWYMQLLPYL